MSPSAIMPSTSTPASANAEWNIHAVITKAISTLPESDREQLLTSLTTIQAQLNLTAREPLPPAKPRPRPAPLVTGEGTIS
jgi:hypothetical protein